MDRVDSKPPVSGRSMGAAVGWGAGFLGGLGVGVAVGGSIGVEVGGTVSVGGRVGVGHLGVGVSGGCWTGGAAKPTKAACASTNSMTTIMAANR